MELFSVGVLLMLQTLKDESIGFEACYVRTPQNNLELNDEQFVKIDYIYSKGTKINTIIE